MNKETKTWLLAGSGICLIGFLWNRFKQPETSLISKNTASGGILSQVGGLLSSVGSQYGNTGIGGGITTAGNILTAAGQAQKALPASTTTSNPSTSNASTSNAPITQAQFVDVIGQFNNIISDIYTPASTVKVAGADAQTKFNEALKWARTAIITTTTRAGTTKASPTVVKLTVGGSIYTLDLTGKQVGTSIPDTPANRASLQAGGYSIF